MTDPIRLLDDPATPKARQRLLRGGEVPLDVGYDEEQGLARLKAAIESSSSVRTRSPASFVAPVWTMFRRASASSAWLWVALPAAATGLWAAQRSTATRYEREAELHRAPPAAPAPAPRRVVPTHPLAAPALVAPPPSAKKPGAESRESMLLAETTHMAELRRVAPSEPARALALVSEGARQFPRGFFAQEREAIAITSLLRLGRRDEARARGQRFLAQHPQGPAAEQIRRAIGEP